MAWFPFRKSRMAVVLLWLGFVSGGPFAAAQQRGAGTTPLPPGKGRDLVMTACTQCHGLTSIVAFRAGRPGWQDTVEVMVLRGSQLLPEEAETVIDYLTANFGPGSRPMPAASSQVGAGATSSTPPAAEAIALPSGPGKDVVEAQCTLCHDLSRVTLMQRPPEEWDRVVKTMVEIGMQASAEEIRAILSYLKAHFGKESQ